MKKFKINEHITLRLIGIKNQETIIFVDGEEFMQCKYLLIVNPQEREEFREITSVDEASELLRNDLERNLKPKDLGITGEEEFWGHCSNLQAWVENDYNINIIHTNLALPLLKELAKKGVLKAKAKLKEVVIEMFKKQNNRKILFLLEGDYLQFFNYDEFKDLYEIFSDTTNLSKKAINIKDIPFYVDLFRSFSAYSRYFSETHDYLLQPIIPDIQNFLKKIKINFDVKKKELWDALYCKLFIDNRYITLKELLDYKIKKF
ncbi:hypothetical protein LCGC14_0701730 [marine sediment metagenome]|uniref:Uncharacterized protein n=1 Tax=marine sediment metagenome TaxID=412755 RepID=A0A0F9TQB1_9ZZZZ|nr:hypothetical protein [bacterium]